MVHQVTREIKNNQSLQPVTYKRPLVSYSKEKGLLTIREAENKLNPVHVEAIKTIIADHLNSRKTIDIVLQIREISRVNLPLLFNLFKYCQGLEEWDKRIDIAWYISDDDMNMQRLAHDFQELYQLNLRIFQIS